MIRPLRNNVLVRIVEIKKGGLVLPDTVKKDSRHFKFVVEQIGPDVKTVSFNDEVIVPYNVGIPVMTTDEDLVIFHEDQILAINEKVKGKALN